jgi:hypothetical protein
VLAAAACVALLPAAWHQWSRQDYGPRAQAQFSAWRERIAPGADVLFPDGPLFAWFMLQRPDYLSTQQEASAVFSRAAALEVLRREEQLRGFPDAVRARVSLDDPTDGARGTLQDLCGRVGTDLGYVISAADLGTPALENAPAAADPHWSTLKLYRCPPGVARD